MATRRVVTKFAAELDASYKKVQNELRQGNNVLNSEMKKLNAQYKDNQNSVEYLNKKLDIQQRQLLNQKEVVEAARKRYAELANSFGEGSEEAMKMATSLNNAEAKMYDMENACRDTGKALSGTGESLTAASSDSEGLGDALDIVGNKLGIHIPDKAKTAVNGLGNVSAGMVAGATAAAAFVAALVKVEQKLMDMTKESASYADEIITLSSTTGLSTEALQEWSYAAELVDVDIGTIQGSLRKLTSNMSNARDGSESAQAAFAKLGVNVTNADGSLRDANTVFYEAIDALGEMTNATERDAAAQDLFGKSAQDLNPLIALGSEGLREYTNEAHEMAYVLSDEQLSALGAVDDAQQRLLNTQEAVSNQISAIYAPYMEKALTMTRDLIQDVGKKLAESGLVESLGSILDSAMSILSPLGKLIADILPALNLVLSPIAGVLALIADACEVIAGMLTLDFSRIGTALGFGDTASNMQKLQYGADYKTDSWGSNSGWTYDSATGQYISNYSYNAAGTSNYRGGVSWVGENGPELVSLPRGSSIQNAQESRLAGGTNNYYVTIDAHNVKDFNDVVRMCSNLRVDARMRG